jgi:glycine/D-amino acid oxidase-like deaminating enzyme
MCGPAPGRTRDACDVSGERVRGEGRSDMLTKAAAVVIGSGALGSSVAFHLAKAGVRPVALLDQHEIASQTSPRAAGLTQMVRDSDLMTDLARIAVDKIVNFTAETGQPIEYHQVGSMKIARSEAHAGQLHDEVARGRRHGIDIDLIGPSEATALMPFFRPAGVTAITYARGDVYLEPVQIPRGYARAVAQHGGALLPHTRVTGIATAGGRVAGVTTTQGEIRTDTVVDAAGAWTRLVGQRAGARIGTVATRHQLLITEPIAGVLPTQPIARIVDCNVYIRPADGGLMLGGYEAEPLQIDMAGRPPDFSVGDLELDLSVLRRLADRVVDQFPVFREIAVREHRGGLPTMTADGEHILGPWPALPGFYVVSGCCVGGLSIAPILGELLADWIVSGSPRMDLTALSPAREAVRDMNDAALLEACRTQYAFHYWADATRPT